MLNAPPRRSEPLRSKVDGASEPASDFSLTQQSCECFMAGASEGLSEPSSECLTAGALKRASEPSSGFSLTQQSCECLTAGALKPSSEELTVRASEGLAEVMFAVAK